MTEICVASGEVQYSTVYKNMQIVSKVREHTRTPIDSFPSPDERFEHVHIDITGPLSPCEGYTYLLTCVYRFSHWCKVLPRANIEPHTTVKMFMAGWVSHFSVSAIITMDRGRQFESNSFSELMKLLGSKRIRMTAYHPESNGLVERFHHSVKSALRAMLNRSNWLENLLLVLLGLLTAVKEGIKCSSADVVYGTTLRLPGKFFCKSPQTPLDVNSFVDCLTAKMANIVYNPPAQCKKPTCFKTI